MSEIHERVKGFADKVWQDVIQLSTDAPVIRMEILDTMVEEDWLAGRLFFETQCKIHQQLTERRHRQVSGMLLLTLAFLYERRGDNSLTQELRKLGPLYG